MHLLNASPLNTTKNNEFISNFLTNSPPLTGRQRPSIGTHFPSEWPWGAHSFDESENSLFSRGSPPRWGSVA